MHSQSRQVSGGAATRCAAAMPACRGEVLAASALIDAAEARWLAFAAAEYERGRVDGEAAWGVGYAQCASDVKAAEHGIYDAINRQAEAERGRWVVRGEVRTRATFGAPHPADYLGGPVAWPELREVGPRISVGAAA